MLLRGVLVRVHRERSRRGAGLLLLLDERVVVRGSRVALASGLGRRLSRAVRLGRRRLLESVGGVVGGERVVARALGQAVSRRFPFRAHEVAEARRHLS